MANTRYLMIKKMFASIDVLNGDEMHLDAIKKAVMIHMGTRPQTVSDILRTLVDMGFIVENSEKPFYYFVYPNPQ